MANGELRHSRHAPGEAERHDALHQPGVGDAGSARRALPLPARPRVLCGEPIRRSWSPVVTEIKKGGATVVGSAIPQRAMRFAKLAEEVGADFFIVQSTVLTARHIATEYELLDCRRLKQELSIPLIVGNCVTYEATLDLMQTGVDALLIGVGQGAACTSREVLGLGVRRSRPPRTRPPPAPRWPLVGRDDRGPHLRFSSPAAARCFLISAAFRATYSCKPFRPERASE
jgi:hypothetical protein